MADVTSVVVGATTVGANYKLSNNFTSDAGKERIISVTKSGSGNVTHAVLAAVYAQLTQAGGDGTGADPTGPDAFTIAGMGTADDTAFASGTDTVVYLRIQGNGTPNLTTVSGATLAAVCTFAPNK
tara:strand:+ start:968 stop:1345 length:378 start_codon:yes stop_codon:yes gene_type:complete